MADWEESRRGRHRHTYYDASYLSPEHAFERRPLSRRPHSKDSRNAAARPRRPSLHREYHSDNEGIGIYPTSAAVDIFRGEFYSPVRVDPPLPAGFRDQYRPRSRSRPRRRHSSPERPSSLERRGPHSRVPSHPAVNVSKFSSAVPVRLEPPAPFAGARWARSTHEERPVRAASRLRPNRRPSSPHLRPTDAGTDHARSSMGAQRPSPPHARFRSYSSVNVVRPPPEPTPEPQDPWHYREVYEGPPGMKLHRKDRTEALDNKPYFIPGEFPATVDNVRPEDSRSEISQSNRERRHWTRWSGGSTSAAGSTHRHSTGGSSGILGDRTYQYSPLGPGEFRLIRLLPARMSTIKCELLHESLYHPPPYTAVSYAWGDADDTRKIVLDGVKIPVAVSLYGALEALRRKNESVTVWIDYLCIDQQNRDEKTQQVQLMTGIYSNAQLVAICLGAEADNSDDAMKLLEVVANIAANADSEKRVRSLISSDVHRPGIAAIVALFERDYWRRLWVVQEVFNARDLVVYCGSLSLRYETFRLASYAFWRHKSDIDYYFPSVSNGGFSQAVSSNQFSYSQVLVHQGPSSLPDVGSLAALGNDSLLEVLRACRGKLSADARDKVFGILGILPDHVRGEFPVDYSLSVKEVYIDAVDYILYSTDQLDVIREAIHFPLHHSSANLPSWVPDWSHASGITSISVGSSASGRTKADYKFHDGRRKLEISAIYLDKVKARGIAVGTLCNLGDYLMAFLHWRAILLQSSGSVKRQQDASPRVLEAFCKTLCMNQVPEGFEDAKTWMVHCLHVFASLIHERLPSMQMDRGLQSYIHMDDDIKIKPEDRRSFLQHHFATKMMGRCLLITEEGRIGMGSGFMALGDEVVVPLGCSTPIILRPHGPKGEYRYVGDAYIHGHMTGKTVDQWENGERELRRFVLQ